MNNICLDDQFLESLIREGDNYESCDSIVGALLKLTDFKLVCDIEVQGMKQKSPVYFSNKKNAFVIWHPDNEFSILKGAPYYKLRKKLIEARIIQP